MERKSSAGVQRRQHWGERCGAPPRLSVHRAPGAARAAPDPPLRERGGAFEEGAELAVGGRGARGKREPHAARLPGRQPPPTHPPARPQLNPRPTQIVSVFSKIIFYYNL